MEFEQRSKFRNILVQLCENPIERIENQTLEIKGWCQDEKSLAQKVADAASCLANADGGIIIVGASDDNGGAGKFSRCPFPNVSAAWLRTRTQDLTHPPVECTSHDLSELLTEICPCGEGNLFALDVPRTRYLGGHVTTAGISKIRVGNECRPRYTAEDDQTQTFFPEASVDDLSLTSIRWAMGEHRRKFAVPEQQWTEPADFLLHARLLDPFLMDGEIAPRYRVPFATLLLFGKEPVLAKRVPFFETIVKTDTGVRRLRKNIVESVRELALSDDSSIRQGCPNLEGVVVQELLVNAYTHRCWRTAAPVIVGVSATQLEIQNPGDLLPGLHVDNLIYCVPAYRNLLLAEGSRFIGLCDKIGQGIDLVFRTVLSGGFEFPSFESHHNSFTARISLARGEEFREFIRRRSQALTQLDEIILLRLLWAKEEATLADLSHFMQRSEEVTKRVLTEMVKKLMIEPADPQAFSFRLSPNIRRDIQTVFKSDQLSLGLSQA